MYMYKYLDSYLPQLFMVDILFYSTALYTLVQWNIELKQTPSTDKGCCVQMMTSIRFKQSRHYAGGHVL